MLEDKQSATGCEASHARLRHQLNQLGHRPRKALGQHFLIDANILEKSLAFAHIKLGETVVEIGPGLGVLTQALIGQGATVYAVEYDATLANYLQQTLHHNRQSESRPDSDEQGVFHLRQGDCLDYPLAGLTPKTPFKIVANLPYAVATPWLDVVLAGPLPERMVLMVQKEAAQRYQASSGNKHYGPMSIFLQSAYQITATHRVSHRCFYPVPEIDSTLLRLDRRAQPVCFPKRVRQRIRALFQQRRKQIATLCQPFPELRRWLALLATNGIPLNSRPEAINLAQWQAIIQFCPKET